MPIWLRRFTFSKLKEHYDKQAEESEKTNQQVANTKGKLDRPDIKPTYSSKVPKK